MRRLFRFVLFAVVVFVWITSPAGNAGINPTYNGRTTAEYAIDDSPENPATTYTLIPEIKTNISDYLPVVGVKTNLLLWPSVSPNLAVEAALNKKWTLNVAAAFNPFQLQVGGVNRFGVIQPEIRYWFCQRFEKHFVGAHLLYGQYNVGQVDFLTTTFRNHRYRGWGAGVGISYGYHLPIYNRWACEFTAGVGYIWLNYDKYNCYECDELVGNKNKHYFGPTKIAVSLIFMLK